MSQSYARLTLRSLARVAVEGTEADRGRLLAASPGTDELRVVAAHGGGDLWQARSPGDIARYVAAAGQPQVLSHGAHLPATLCVPCFYDDEVMGTLELEDKQGGLAFTIDDVELATLLGGIAGVALARSPVMTVPDPSRLVADLTRLATADATRYATIARWLKDLLDA